MRKFISNSGNFPCRYCGTVYQWSDLRDACEGNEYFRDEPYRYVVLDLLGLEVGDKVLKTRYVGEDYPPDGFKCGVKLVWSYVSIRDKRIIPGVFHYNGSKYLHSVQYRVEAEDPIIGYHWDVGDDFGGYSVGVALGPRHLWTKESCKNDNFADNFEEYIKNQYCYGEDTPETLQKLVDEGYFICGISKRS